MKILVDSNVSALSNIVKLGKTSIEEEEKER